MTKQQYSKIFKIIFISVFFSLLIIKAVKDSKKDDLNMEIQRREFPFISEEDSICGIVKEKSSLRGVLSVQLDNNKKLSIDHSRNYKYEPPCIDDFIGIGDLLVKNSFSDTLFVSKKGNTYFFVVGEFIGN